MDMNYLPKVSIVIATYNAEDLIERALNSIKVQTFFDWECIVVDGNSTDGTIKVVESFSQKDCRIKYISEKDQGIFDAYNKGWKLAKGEYVYYLGADDTIDTDALEHVFSNIDNDSEIIYGDLDIRFFDNSVKHIKAGKLSVLNYKMLIGHQAIIMKRNILEEMGGFDIKYPVAADYDILQRCYLQKKKFMYIPVTIANFSYTGVSSHFSLKNERELYLITKKNKANKFPAVYSSLLTIRHFLGFIQKKYITHMI